MKTWVLVWILTFQPNESGQYEWVYEREIDLAYAQCVQLLAEKDAALPEIENYSGHQIYCKNTKRLNIQANMLRSDI